MRTEKEIISDLEAAWVEYVELSKEYPEFTEAYYGEYLKKEYPLIKELDEVWKNENSD